MSHSQFRDFLKYAYVQNVLDSSVYDASIKMLADGANNVRKIRIGTNRTWVVQFSGLKKIHQQTKLCSVVELEKTLYIIFGFIWLCKRRLRRMV